MRDLTDDLEVHRRMLANQCASVKPVSEPGGLTFALSGARAPKFVAEPPPLSARPLERGVGRHHASGQNRWQSTISVVQSSERSSALWEPLLVPFAPIRHPPHPLL